MVLLCADFVLELVRSLALACDMCISMAGALIVLNVEVVYILLLLLLLLLLLKCIVGQLSKLALNKNSKSYLVPIY